MENKMPKWKEEIKNEKLERKQSIYSVPIETNDNPSFNEDAFLNYLDNEEIDDRTMKLLMNF